MKLTNPPVIQSWIAIEFDPAPDKKTWDIQIANAFFLRHQNTLPHHDIAWVRHVEIKDFSPAKLPEIIPGKIEVNHVRGRNEQGTFWVQVSADDRLVCNITRGSGSYAGYEYLRDQAILMYIDYVELFKPTKVRRVDLHYVDLIEIPVPPDKKIKLEDYFEFYIKSPGKFDNMLACDISVALSTPRVRDAVEVRFQTEPMNENSNTYRFRMDWNLTCNQVETLDRDEIVRWLDEAHDCVRDYFRSSFTDRMWEMFGPSESRLD